MDDSGRPQSLYVVVVRDDLRAPYFCSILHLDSKPKSHKVLGFPLSIKSKWKSVTQMRQLNQNEYAAQFRKHLDHQKEYVAHFNLLDPPATRELPSIDWMFTPLPCSNPDSSGLCLLPCFGSGSYRSDVPPLHGFTFNFRTGTYRRITPSKSSTNFGGCVLYLGAHIYYMPQPDAFFHTPNLLFERYDPVGDSWATLSPFPLPPHDVHNSRCILATAVWDDTLVFNMGGHEFWAYNATTDTWYPVAVKVEDAGLCYCIVGEAVVLGNTIYALKDKSYNSILALSIQQSVEQNNNGDIVYTCSLLSEISVPDIERVSSTDGNALWETRYLVHLGKDDFCLVQSCMLDCFPAYYLPIQVTYLKLEGNDRMIVINNRVHKVPILDNQQFRVAFCFSLPDPPAAGVRQIDRFFDIDPYPEGVDISQIDSRNEEDYVWEKSSASASSSSSVAAKSNVHASSSKTAVEGGGGLRYNGRPLDSYTLREKVVIVNRWRQQISERNMISAGKKKSPLDGEDSSSDGGEGA